jgi:hypothetical protein
MADRLTRHMTDGSPRDPSKMASNNHTGLYTALVIGAALILGFVVYSSSDYGVHDAANPPTPPATTTQ